MTSDPTTTLPPSLLPTTGVPTPPPSPPPNSLDDVFGSAPSSPIIPPSHLSTLPSSTNTPDLPPLSSRDLSAHPSDIPRLRGTHVTNGYRDGVATSKSAHVQAGFDEGYGVGAELALRAGWCLGVLEGVLRAVRKREKEEEKGGEGEVRGALGRAGRELSVEGLMGPEFFGEDGLWRYEVPGQRGEREGEVRVSFREVAGCHPVLRRWVEEVEAVAKGVGVEVVLG